MVAMRFPWKRCGWYLAFVGSASPTLPQSVESCRRNQPTIFQVWGRHSWRESANEGLRRFVRLVVCACRPKNPSSAAVRLGPQMARTNVVVVTVHDIKGAGCYRRGNSSRGPRIAIFNSLLGAWHLRFPAPSLQRKNCGKNGLWLM